MNKRIDFTRLGILYMYQSSFAFMQDAYEKAFAGIAEGMGDKWVLKGCIDNGTTVSDGVIIIGDKIVPFTGGVKAGNPSIRINISVVKELFDDGNMKDTYYEVSAQLSALGDFAYTELKRLPSGGILKNISDLQTVVKQAINYEDTVILKGGLVSDINTSANTCNISAGTALFDGLLVSFAAQTGITYPCYLLPNGSFTNALPSGLNVRYNPHTSQYYKDVLKRAVTAVGEIKMFETLSDRFDSSGKGRWEMQGFELVSALQNRVPIGLWWDGVAENNVSSSNNQIATTKHGSNAVQIQDNNLPEHFHPYRDRYYAEANLNSQLVPNREAMPNNYNNRHGSGDSDNDNTHFLYIDTDTGNNVTENTPISVVQAVTVVVYAKRI